MAATTPAAEALPMKPQEVPPTPADAPQPVAAGPALTAAPQALTPEGTPDWVGEIWRKYSTRVLDYFRQAFALLLHPRRFMEEWATGQREALNPLRFLGLGFLLAVTARHLGEQYLLGPALEAQGLTSLLKTPVGVEFIFLALTLPAHGVMRLSGSRSPFSVTLAAVIFAFMGPVILMQVSGWLVSALVQGITGALPLFELKAGFATRLYRHNAYPWPLMVANWAALIYCTLTIAGAHRKRWAWAALALLVAHLVFVPTISLLMKLEVQDLLRLISRVTGG